MNEPTDEEVRILLVEDNPMDAEIARREIARELAHCVFRRVETAESFLSELAAFAPRLIISDYSLPRFDGLAALRLAQEHAPLTPLIILTGSMNEDTAVNCMKAGASNYVIKEQIKRLGQSVLHALEEGRLRRERQLAEQTLQRSERYFRSLIENAQDLITVLDARGQVLFQSPSVERILGYSLAAFLHRNIFELIHPVDRDAVAASFQRTLAMAKVANSIEFRLRHADGSWKTLECVGNFLAQSEPPAVVVNSRDVTDRHRLEEQLRQSQKMEAMGQLASGVAHDFNNILTSIMGNASLLRQDESLTPEQAGTVNEITLAAERASALTRRLLLFSRKQELHLVNLDLNEVIGQTVKMLQRLLGKTILVRTDYAASLPLIRGDLVMLDLVLLNLAVNARDAMPAGGELNIQTAVKKSPQESGSAPSLPAVCLSVRDTGCGIPPEHLKHIFEPFFTTKEVGKGTGLGLATVYGIIKQHGGSVTVESQVGHGTTFEMVLPGIADRGESSSPTVTPKIAAGAEVILLVEDELPVRLVANRLLQRCGYEVLLAASGPEALQVWAQNKSRIQLLLTDIVMPDGLTGHQLVAQLRNESPKLRVIYSSGYSPEMAGRNLEPETGTRFLQKPYTFAELSKTVRECLDEPGTAADP